MRLITIPLSYGKPVAATMCIGPKGDQDGVSAAECGVRYKKIFFTVAQQEAHPPVVS